MTENADVQWLRSWDEEYVWPVVVDRARALRLLAHINELEAEAKLNLERGIKWRDRYNELEAKGRPTVHEIAAQMMAAILTGPAHGCVLLSVVAEEAYNAAEALVAEGRRRDGLQK